MITNCATTPAATAPGRSPTSMKSATLKVRPIPSMISPSPGSIHLANQVQSAGRHQAQAQPRTIHSGNAAAKREQRRCIMT
jgi:hypothetical protein